MENSTSAPFFILNPSWISQILRIRWSSPVSSSFTSVCTDSRLITPGTLFVAIAGPTRHGQEFLSQAKASGAIGAIVETLQPIDLPQIVVSNSVAALQKLAKARRKDYTGTLIALTGSSGKTSTKELLAHLLGDSDTHKTSGNFNNHIGVPLTLLSGDISKKFWVIEAGISTPGEMSPLEQMIRPDAGLLTMIGSVHLEALKTRAGIAEEKAKLFANIPREGKVFLHAQDATYPALKHYPPLHMEAKSDATGWTLTFNQTDFHLPLWTPGTVRNAALCLALAQEFGIPTGILQSRLLSWQGVSLRGQWVRFKNAPPTQRIYFDAYNSNPEALADSLWRFRHISNPKKSHLYIIGTMGELGEDSNAMHRTATAALHPRPADSVILVGTKAAILAEGLKNSQAQSIEIIDDLEKIKEALTKFDGECFIKGSHSTGLHKLAEACF